MARHSGSRSLSCDRAASWPRRHGTPGSNQTREGPAQLATVRSALRRTRTSSTLTQS